MSRRIFPFGSADRKSAAALYLAVVEQARQSEFYADMGVPDTIDGRFDMILLHAFLLLRRLRSAGKQGHRLSQAIFDVMFADMDRNLREMGVGDLSVGKRVKKMVAAFYGRMAAYDSGLETDEADLGAALSRNLYGTSVPAPGQLEAMADYVRSQDVRLAAQEAAELLAGRVIYGDPPGAAAGPSGRPPVR